MINVVGSPLGCGLRCTLRSLASTQPGGRGRRRRWRRSCRFGVELVGLRRQDTAVHHRRLGEARFPVVDGLTARLGDACSRRRLATYQRSSTRRRGKVLYRRSLVNYANGLVWDYYPGAAVGGTQHTVDLTQSAGRRSRPTLIGNNAHAYYRLDDDDVAESSEESAAGRVRDHSVHSERDCARRAPRLPLLVGPAIPAVELVADEPQAERGAGVLLRQHVPRPPARRTDRLHRGGRQLPAVNSTGQGLGGDRCRRAARRRDTLCCGGGCRTPNHIDNANMGTPPDGSPPRMQMYLFHEPGTAYPDDDPFIAGERRRRGRHRLPRVHARPVEPARRRRGRQLDARRRPGRRDGRGVERLVRLGLPRQPGLRDGHRRGRRPPGRRLRRPRATT